MRIKPANILSLGLMFSFFFVLSASRVQARQQIAANTGVPTAADSNKSARKSADDKREEKPSTAPGVEERLKVLEDIIVRQQREIEALREIVEKRGAEDTTARSSETSPSNTSPSNISPSVAAHPAADQPQVIAASVATPASGKNESTQDDPTQKRVDELYKKFGSLSLSGDIRFRYESFRNQGFDSLNKSPDRNRLRVRARAELDGKLNKNFDWGIRLATGIFTDPITTNQTLTDFFERKGISLDRAFVRYDSKTDGVGVQFVAGKFEPTFRRTQMVWDDDVNVEGASEALYFKTGSALKQVKLVAFQLPFNELSGDKDGVLYGGQGQADFKLSSKVSADFNIGYYDWVRADQIVRALGASSTQVNGGISNGAGVTGNQNGSLGTTNRIIRDVNGNPIGFLAGFNLFDVLGNVTWQATSHTPVKFTFDYVHNFSERIDDKNNGYWTGVAVGQTKEKGDWLLGYTFAHIEQDAVLVPFNFSDILASNSIAHIPTAAYQLAGGVTLQWTGLFSRRLDKLVPLSPFNRYLNRMQFDVIYKF